MFITPSSSGGIFVRRDALPRVPILRMARHLHIGDLWTASAERSGDGALAEARYSRVKRNFTTSRRRRRSKEGGHGYSIEVFNAIGETIAVTAVPESALEPLRKDEVLSVRALAAK